jgi:hypothetical protein
MTALADKAAALLALHTDPEILVLANVWDVVSAQVVASTDGAKALATASHSIASTFGYEDGENIPLELHLDMVARIVRAVDLPVTMDFEAGYGDPGETARRAIEVGVVGANLEDQMKPLAESVAAVEAVVRAGRDAEIDFVLNARTDAFLRAAKDDDRGELVKEAVARGQAYLEAGAPVVFVPGAGRARRDRRPRGRPRPQHADRHQCARRLAPGSRAAGARSRPCLDRAVHPARCPDRAAGRRPGDLGRRCAAEGHPRAELMRRPAAGQQLLRAVPWHTAPHARPTRLLRCTTCGAGGPRRRCQGRAVAAAPGTSASAAVSRRRTAGCAASSARVQTAVCGALP